jgi:hypothetical protein
MTKSIKDPSKVKLRNGKALLFAKISNLRKTDKLTKLKLNSRHNKYQDIVQKTS